MAWHALWPPLNIMGTESYIFGKCQSFVIMHLIFSLSCWGKLSRQCRRNRFQSLSIEHKLCSLRTAASKASKQTKKQKTWTREESAEEQEQWGCCVQKSEPGRGALSWWVWGGPTRQDWGPPHTTSKVSEGVAKRSQPSASKGDSYIIWWQWKGTFHFLLPRKFKQPVFNCIKTVIHRAGELVQYLRALAILPDDPHSITRNHLTVHNQLRLQF